MKKLLLISLVNINLVFAWTNGKMLTTHSFPNNINNLTISTVGIYINEGKLISRCTGVMINNNQFISAAHCFSTVPASSQISLYFVGNNTPITYFTDDIKFDKNLDNYIKNPQSLDYTVVTLPEPVENQKYLSKSNLTNLTNLKTQWHDAFGAPGLVPSSGSNFYVVGWANGSFEYQVFNMPDKYTKDKTLYLTSAKNQVILPFDGNSYTNAEPGDSGGPLFQCDNKNQNCSLVGIVMAIHKERGDTYFTPLPVVQ